MHRTLYRSSIILLLLISLTACSNIMRGNVPKGMTATELYEHGEQELAKNNSSSAIKYFDQLQSEYPLSQYAQQAQLNLVYAYYRKGDYGNAILAADHYIRLYPRSENTDYVYYVRGISNFQQNRTILTKVFPINPADRDVTSLQRSFQDFRMLLLLFPNSQYAPDARQRMVYLRDKLAEHEVDVAKYYYRREAYVAAANRGSYVVQHFQHAPKVEQALAIMVKSYRRLNEAELAKESFVVLERSFPDSPYLKKLRG